MLLDYKYFLTTAILHNVHIYYCLTYQSPLEFKLQHHLAKILWEQAMIWSEPLFCIEYLFEIFTGYINLKLCKGKFNTFYLMKLLSSRFHSFDISVWQTYGKMIKFKMKTFPLLHCWKSRIRKLPQKNELLKSLFHSRNIFLLPNVMT